MTDGVIKNYHEAVDFLESLANISTTEGRTQKRAEAHVKRVCDFLRFLGNPEKKLKIIHIAGTSGKGSVTAMLHNIFLADGKNVGSYTSPHTTTFCERIKVGDKYIGEKDLVALTNFLKNKMDEWINKKTKKQKNKKTEENLSLNFFESSFVLALLYFQKMHCEYAVIETGCGGRYDATNAIQKPIYTIITNIGADHLEIIGPTLKDVVYEKAGIVKPGAVFLTGEKNKNWIKIFQKELRKFPISSDKVESPRQSRDNFQFPNKSQIQNFKTINWKNLKNINVSLDGTEFKYEGEQYKLKLLGKHQAENAALAIECAKDLGVDISEIKSGLLKTFYPARLEVVSKRPLIIVDGAHNEDKLRAATDFIKSNHPKGQRYLIIAAAKNKRIKKIMPMLKSYFDVICATRFSNPFRKALDFGDWQRGFANKKILYYHYPHDALRAVLTKLGKYDLLLITGSIFLAGELRENWYSEKEIIKNRKSEF